MFRDVLHACMYALPTETRRGYGIPRNLSHQSYMGPENWTRSSGRPARAHNYKLSFKALKKGNSYTQLVGILVLHRSYTEQYEIPRNIFIKWSSYPRYWVQGWKSAYQGLCSCAVAALLTKTKIWDLCRYLSGHKESKCSI